MQSNQIVNTDTLRRPLTLAVTGCYWPTVRIRRRLVDDGNRCIVIATTGPCVSDSIAREPLGDPA